MLEFSDEANWPAPEVDEAPWPEAPSLLTTTSRRGSNSISISRASSNLSARHQIGSVPSGIPSVSTGLDRVRLAQTPVSVMLWMCSGEHLTCQVRLSPDRIPFTVRRVLPRQIVDPRCPSRATYVVLACWQ